MGGVFFVDSYKFISNSDCKYWPCHKGVRIFNCKHCYCPLYWIECEGDFEILPNGVKDCSKCKKPHEGERGHKWIVEQLKKKFSSES